MTTLLRIDASLRQTGSSTRTLTQYFEDRWREAHPDGRVLRRCLASEPVPHLTQAQFEAYDPDRKTPTNLSEILVDELLQADHLLIGSPLYNLTLPSTLKAYFDHVVRFGTTFERDHDGALRGLLQGKRAVVITARGSVVDEAVDFQQPYLRHILAFVGITEIESVALAGTVNDANRKRAAIEAAKHQVDRWLDGTTIPEGDPPEVGERRAIERLREGQSDAILRGDAQAYADLCTDDVRLLIPGHEVVAGRAALLEAEAALFRSTRFVGFRKTPLSLELEGDLAVEVGNQEVETEGAEGQGGVFAARQKYTHVFRRTPQGWRFAVLMSNPSG